MKYGNLSWVILIVSNCFAQDVIPPTVPTDVIPLSTYAPSPSIPSPWQPTTGGPWQSPMERSPRSPNTGRIWSPSLGGPWPPGSGSPWPPSRPWSPVSSGPWPPGSSGQWPADPTPWNPPERWMLQQSNWTQSPNSVQPTMGTQVSNSSSDPMTVWMEWQRMYNSSIPMMPFPPISGSSNSSMPIMLLLSMLRSSNSSMPMLPFPQIPGSSNSSIPVIPFSPMTGSSNSSMPLMSMFSMPESSNSSMPMMLSPPISGSSNSSMSMMPFPQIPGSSNSSMPVIPFSPMTGSSNSSMPLTSIFSMPESSNSSMPMMSSPPMSGSSNSSMPFFPMLGPSNTSMPLMPLPPLLPSMPPGNINQPMYYDRIEGERNIMRPCEINDMFCIRRYLRKHSHCKERYGSIPEPFYKAVSPSYYPRVNMTVSIEDILYRGLNGRITEFYVNPETDNLVLSVKFDNLSLESNNTFFRFHRELQEPIVTRDFFNVLSFSPEATIIIPNLKDLQLHKSEVFTYVDDALPRFAFGPNAFLSNAYTARVLTEFTANIPANVREDVLTSGPFYIGTFIQYRLCDFGLQIL